MALTGKTVSLAHIIEKTQGVSRLIQKAGMSTLSIAEHVYTAMGLIGIATAYDRKKTDGIGDNPPPIVVENHRGELPCGLHDIISAKEGTYGYPMIEDTSTFRQQYNDTDSSTVIAGPITYSLQGNFIFPRFKEGTIIIEYLSFPVDASGLPVIPDDVRYIQAIVAYLSYMAALSLWMEDKISDRKFNYLEREWLFYVKSANTGSKVPRIDKLESLRNQSVRMISNSHHHSNQFKYRNNPEALNIK